MKKAMLWLWPLWMLSISLFGQDATQRYGSKDVFQVVPVMINRNAATINKEELGVDDVAGYLDRGIEYLDNDQYEEALKDFDHAISVYPDYAYSYYYRSITYYLLEKYRLAKADMLQVIKLDNSIFHARWILGAINYQLEEYDEARDNLELARKAMPKNPEPSYFLGLLDYRLHTIHELDEQNPVALNRSLQHFTSAIEIDPEFIYPYVYLGYIHLVHDHTDRAARYLKTAIEIDSTYSPTYLVLGYANLLKRNTGKCVKNWTTLTQLEPDDSHYFTLLGSLHAWIGNFGKATDNLIMAARTEEGSRDQYDIDDPLISRSMDLQYALLRYDKQRGRMDKAYVKAMDNGIALLFVNAYDAAVLAFKRAAAKAPEEALPVYLRGVTNEYMGKIELAYKNYNEAIALDNRFFDAFMKRGLINYYEKKNIRQALNDFNRMIRINPESVLAYRYRAMIKKLVGDYGGANLDYSTFLNKVPDNTEVLTERGICLERLGYYDQAKADYVKAHKLLAGVEDAEDKTRLNNRDDQELLLDTKTALGRIALAQGDTLQAIRIANVVIGMDKTHAAAHTLRGRILMYQRNLDKALGEFSKALGSDKILLDTYLYRGKTYLLAGKAQKAVGDFNQVLKYQPRNSEAWYGRALAYKMAGKEEQAAADLARAQKLGFEETVWDLPLKLGNL